MEDEGNEMHRILMGPDNDLSNEPNVLHKDQVWQLEDRNGFVQITGQLLGFASSKRDQHSHPVNSAQQELIDRIHQGARCAACRWSEIYIFKIVAGDGPPTAAYAVYTLGPSIVEGENTRARLRWASSGYEVMELCTVRRGDRGTPWLPAAHSTALAMAADIDARVENAYVNRAVA
jgi:hypothetical protein